MHRLGSHEHPVRVAVIGAGPAGFYAAAALLKATQAVIEVDMYDRLPTPFGLVRAGVAPDHQKDKSVAHAFDRSAKHARFRFCGNVEYGSDLTLTDLHRHYHQVIFATGTQSDRALNIPGEHLDGSHSATDFVAWYNGHPDYVDRAFDLSCEHVAVVGIGNVALDVARILCRDLETLEHTDIADHALVALRASRVRQVSVLGRRGPAQAAFTPAELDELGGLAGTDIVVRPEEAMLDPASRETLATNPDRNATGNVERIERFARRSARGARRQLALRFLVTPLAILGDASGRVTGIRLARNVPFLADDGSVKVRPTGAEEILPAGLVFRSVGYRGIGLPGLPFDAHKGVIPNDRGRVVDASGRPIGGLYVSGWIKRGPRGVIGTNKTDARETVAAMLEDLAAGRHRSPPRPSAAAAAAHVASLTPRVVSYGEWSMIDAEETRRGRQAGRPRVKFTRLDEFLGVLER